MGQPLCEEALHLLNTLLAGMASNSSEHARYGGLPQDLEHCSRPDLRFEFSISPLSQMQTPETLDRNIANIATVLRSVAMVCHERMSELSRRRNALAPIHRLPVKVIIRVFSYLVGGWLPRRPPKEHHHNMHVLAQVCNTWAEILLAYPPFWTVADGDGGDVFLRTTLRRSMNRPLQVTFTAPRELDSHRSTWPLACQHIHRWESARIRRDERRSGSVGDI